MRLSDDPETDSLYIHLIERPSTDSDEVADGVHDEMRALSQELGIPFVDLYPFYAKQTKNLSRDGIHHNVQGQMVLANTLHDAELAQLGSQIPPGAVSR
jgi:lysophospholipase L1-like esterase